jgi:hypothetical protein
MRCARRSAPCRAVRARQHKRRRAHARERTCLFHAAQTKAWHRGQRGQPAERVAHALLPRLVRLLRARRRRRRLRLRLRLRSGRGRGGHLRSRRRRCHRRRRSSLVLLRHLRAEHRHGRHVHRLHRLRLRLLLGRLRRRLHGRRRRSAGFGTRAMGTTDGRRTARTSAAQPPPPPAACASLCCCCLLAHARTLPRAERTRTGVCGWRVAMR